jgi:hypothetical protein
LRRTPPPASAINSTREISGLGAVSKKLSAAAGFVFRLWRCQAPKALDVALPRLRAFQAFGLASEKHAHPRDKILLETAPRVNKKKKRAAEPASFIPRWEKGRRVAAFLCYKIHANNHACL